MDVSIIIAHRIDDLKQKHSSLTKTAVNEDNRAILRYLHSKS